MTSHADLPDTGPLEDTEVESSPADELEEELEQTVTELEALTQAHQQCLARMLELESVLETLLDDPVLRVAVLAADRTIIAISRGMAEALGLTSDVVGKPWSAVAPPELSGLPEVLEAVVDDGVWHPLDLPDADWSAQFCSLEEGDDPVYVVRAIAS